MIWESLYTSYKNKKHIHMKNIENILIVDDSVEDQQSVALLFKRSLHGLPNVCFTITCVSSLSEAKDRLAKEQFSIITLDGEFPGIDGLWGHTLIPFIKEHQLQAPKIIMISGKQIFITKGLNRGANFGFHKEAIKGNVRLNENFDLIPIHHV